MVSRILQCWGLTGMRANDLGSSSSTAERGSVYAFEGLVGYSLPASPKVREQKLGQQILKRTKRLSISHTCGVQVMSLNLSWYPTVLKPQTPLLRPGYRPVLARCGDGETLLRGLPPVLRQTTPGALITTPFIVSNINISPWASIIPRNDISN